MKRRINKVMSESSNVLGNLGTVFTKIAGVPIEEYGDTMKIEGVIVGDGKKRVDLILPGENPPLLGPNHRLTIEEALAWLQQSDDPTSPVYTDEYNKVVKAMVRKAKYQVDQNVAWKVYERAGYKCEYCGAKGVPLTYDHLLAQAYGGTTTIENGVSACRPCNKAKGHKTLAEWVEYMRERKLEHAEYWADKAKGS
jgi:hypothetical protein